MGPLRIASKMATQLSIDKSDIASPLRTRGQLGTDIARPCLTSNTKKPARKVPGSSLSVGVSSPIAILLNMLEAANRADAKKVLKIHKQIPPPASYLAPQ